MATAGTPKTVVKGGTFLVAKLQAPTTENWFTLIFGKMVLLVPVRTPSSNTTPPPVKEYALTWE
jgi:hypothetical protein